jgi:ABC-type uncharacterized transport system involved in gliding motility auxiliary subunit
MSIFHKYSKYLILLGIALAIAGLIPGVITNHWSVLYLSLLGGGSAIAVVGLGWWLKNNSQGFWQQRSTQAGTNALVAVMSVIIILGLVNFLATRYEFRIDLTEDQLFTLSSQSQELVKNLNQPLKVWVFERQEKPISQELLANYRRYNPDNFQFEFVDPEIQIGLAKKFKVQVIGEVYLESGTQRQLVQTLNEDDNISEIQLTNAIAKIQRDRPEYVYFLQGHGEPPLDNVEGGMSQAADSLNAQGYEVEPLNLAENAVIPNNTNTLVLAGAKNKLFPGEVKALQQYLDRGGSLLLMLDPNMDLAIDPILKDWGIKLDQRLVIDGIERGSLLGLGPATIVISRYSNHPITQSFANNTSVYPLSRPIGTVKVKNVEAISLVATDDKTWAESNLASGELAFNPNQDVQGPLDIAVAFTRQLSIADKKQAETTPKPSETKSPEATKTTPKPSETKSPEATKTTPETTPKPSEANTETEKTNEKPETESKTEESRLVVFGSSTFATNGWFQQQLNGDVLMNSIKWLAKNDDNPLAISPREPKDRRLKLSSFQASILGWMALFLVPLLGLFTAGITWWRRR